MHTHAALGEITCETSSVQQIKVPSGRARRCAKYCNGTWNAEIDRGRINVDENGAAKRLRR
jgi:hypothetical protein